MRPTIANFPTTRLRRMRRTAALRDLAQEYTLSVKDLIWPIFIREGANIEQPIASMPGV